MSPAAASGLSVIVEADGGARGNPGPAGYGAVVLDASSGAVLAERAGGLGHTTNNVAEYSGLIAGLRAAADLGATAAEVRMDSKLVVEQLSGRWQVKQEHLKPLAREAASLVRRIGSVRFTWIPRARNGHADRLANEAMDAQASGQEWQPKPAANPAPAPSPQAPPPSWTGHAGSPTRFVLLRHGQTERSVARQYAGRADVPLTPLGERQAVAAIPRLTAIEGIAAVVSSPLRRCRDTADVVADGLGLPVTVHDGFIETDFGEWDGLSFAEAAAHDPDAHARWLGDSSVAPPGGESFDSTHRRVRRARDQLITAHAGATVLVVSHVTPIKSLLRMALDAKASLLYRLHLDVASLSIADFYSDGGATVRLVNDTSHLAGL